jgi:hypothetical protein
MSHFLRGLGWASCCALALTVSAAGQSYPPQGYPNYPPPPSYQGYPPPNYPAQNYSSQPPQQYPPQQPQQYPAQGYPPQNAQNQPASASPVCLRLEAQLATVNSGNGDAARQAQIQQGEQAVAKQQADLDRTLAQARRAGCAGQGFFSLFSGLSPQCMPLNSKIDKMRGDLDTAMSNLEQLKSGNQQDAQRATLISQLAQNNCGAQYTQAARAAGPQGFFEALLGGGTVISPGGDGAPAGTYRTVCVRSCDGFYFPISYSTVPGRFSADAQACQRLCPGAQVSLYTYHNPGEEIEQAVSVDGAPYSALPNAFRYRKEIVAGCSCRPPGETWAQALRNADDSSTLENGDIVVTDKNEKALTQVPQGATAKPQGAGGHSATNATPAPQSTGGGNEAVTDPKDRKVRIVGPPFLSQ